MDELEPEHNHQDIFPGWYPPDFTIKKWRNICHCPKRKSGQVFEIYRPIVKTVTFLP